MRTKEIKTAFSSKIQQALYRKKFFFRKSVLIRNQIQNANPNISSSSNKTEIKITYFLSIFSEDPSQSKSIILTHL